MLMPFMRAYASQLTPSICSRPIPLLPWLKWRITGNASSTPSICFSRSTYLVSRLAVVAVSWTAPGRMKINSARTFVARRCKSFDIPRARPVNSMTRLTPSATPATLTSVRIGRWRMFEVTRLSIYNECKLCNLWITNMKTHKSPFIYSLSTLIIMLALVLVGRSFAPDRVQITILGTTDLHGNIDPIDYYTNKPDNRGIAKIATLIKRIRNEQPNVLLIDSGDTIQGSPLESFHGRKNNAPKDPMMLVMNSP